VNYSIVCWLPQLPVNQNHDMHTKIMTTRSFSRCLTVSVAPLLLALALMLPGCATPKQVSEIVVQSNAAMLAGQFGLPEPGAATAKPAWEEATDRIEAFIAAHPDQPAAIASLRVRQAMLLLSYRQFSLAEAAFNAVAITDLHTDRDQALKRNQDTLLWWFANSTNATWTGADQNKSQAAIKQLKEEQSRLNSSPEIRDYLAEMRVWIGLSAAKQTASTSHARELVEDALNVYAEVFTPEDLKILSAGQEQLPDPKALGPDVRRRLRAKAVLAQAQKLNKDAELGAHPKSTEFDQLINK
jgi:hypothetical protein